ncbi:DNA alkylation repair protein [Metamycoplasma phocicerebrale]|uniref:DNA alkylation repair protein n=2 Tax=Metamycoplasma phocicerebrale TaxID=142649 RepID=A0A3T0TUL5_9BACT|nr:DNA alkylation repair protein [Metamycoplasma phocicerebrale]
MSIINFMKIEEIQKTLFLMQDLKYKKFNCNLIPEINAKEVIGVRVPNLRKFAKDLFKNNLYKKFLIKLPHKYFEENSIHGFIINEMENYDEVIKQLNIFLPYVNNWANCDLINPKKSFIKNINKLEIQIIKWTKANEIYTIRFAIKMLMTYFLDDSFKKEHLDIVLSIKSTNYYINMMRAWYFATALAKQYNSTISYIENKKIDNWTHKKTIQKAIESFRINENQKKYLKKLK